MSGPLTGNETIAEALDNPSMGKLLPSDGNTNSLAFRNMIGEIQTTTEMPVSAPGIQTLHGNFNCQTADVPVRELALATENVAPIVAAENNLNLQNG